LLTGQFVDVVVDGDGDGDEIAGSFVAVAVAVNQHVNARSSSTRDCPRLLAVAGAALAQLKVGA